MCAAYTKIETCHIQAHEVCRIHACTMQHTAYISATVLHTQYIYIACMLHTQKLAQRYAVRVQLFTCSMYAAHNNCTHVAYMYSDVCELMCMLCGMRKALSQFLCMQHTCNMDVFCVQHVCSICTVHVVAVLSGMSIYGSICILHTVCV